MSDELGGGEKKPVDWAAIVASFTKAVAPIAHHLGVPTVIYVMLFGTIYAFGGNETRDEFIRALLFPAPEKAELRWFFGALVVAMVIGGYLRQRENKAEKSELERLRMENERLQKKLLEATPVANPPALSVVSKDGG